MFVLQHRLPMRLLRAGWRPWFSVMSTNLAIAAVIGLLVALLGARQVRASSPASLEDYRLPFNRIAGTSLMQISRADRRLC